MKPLLVTLACAVLISLGFCVWSWRAWNKPGVVEPIEPRDDTPPDE